MKDENKDKYLRRDIEKKEKEVPEQAGNKKGGSSDSNKRNPDDEPTMDFAPGSDGSSAVEGGAA